MENLGQGTSPQHPMAGISDNKESRLAGTASWLEGLNAHLGQQIIMLEDICTRVFGPGPAQTSSGTVPQDVGDGKLAQVHVQINDLENKLSELSRHIEHLDTL